MRKTIFIANRWVKYKINGEIYIGVTYLYDETDPEEPLNHLVFGISQTRKSKVFLFSECFELRYLEFVTRQDLTTELKVRNEILTFSSQSELFISTEIMGKAEVALAQKQLNSIFKN